MAETALLYPALLLTGTASALILVTALLRILSDSASPETPTQRP